FQAEDGIRDYKVTGVQTCALPIYLANRSQKSGIRSQKSDGADCLRHDLAIGRLRARAGDRLASETQALDVKFNGVMHLALDFFRSEERRVGKECRSWWSR